MNCPNCQTSNPEQAKFCMNCGTSLDAAKIGEIKPKDKSLEKFIPPELMAKFEAARAQDVMVGERRIITMLFCDVKGSTSAAEKVDPEIWADIMNGIFEFMIRPVYKYEGTIPRLMGDAILAFFGAPISHEDDPQRAVLAGLEIQAGIKDYIEETRLKHGLEFGLRVGINTGLVVVGEIGSDLRMEYTALGDAINLAARMEQTAQVGTIQISDETYKLVTPFFDVEALGGVAVKGKSEPVQTYRVLGVLSTPGQIRGVEGLSSPLVGRESQLVLLKERVSDLGKGKGSVVTLVGEAGLGKSTLIAALKKSNKGKQFTWLRGDSLSYTRSISYYPWRQVIRQAVNAQEEDSPADVREKLSQFTKDGLPFLESILAVESDESTKIVTSFQGDTLNQQIVDAIRKFLIKLAEKKSFVIAFDDLHWSDGASLNLLLQILDLASTQPILFICMARPDTTAASWSMLQKCREQVGGLFYSINLAPLETGQTEILLNNLLGINDLPKSIRDLIVKKADGNPFFIEEIIRSLIETKQIIKENGHWKALSEETNINLPSTLRGVLSARIDRLAETPKRVLQNAAVIGRSFDLRILGRLTRLNGELNPQIQYLQDVSLIEGLLEEYAFRHVLIQEATYESILIKKRAELHQQIGEALEELHSDRMEEFAPLLANHFFNAGDERSLKYDIIAGEKSARLYANTEAITHFTRALETAKRINVDKEQLMSIYLQLGQACELSGQYDHALDTYKDMQSNSIKQGDRSMELKSLIALATIYSTLTPIHDSELGETILKQAINLADELKDAPAQAKLRWNLMLNYLFANRITEALEYCEPTTKLARQVGDRDQLAFTLNDTGRVYQSIGAYEKSFKVFNEANEIWTQLGNQVMLADNLGASAMAHYFAGNFDNALKHSDQAWVISNETDNYWGKSYSRVVPLYIYIDRGLPDLVIQATKDAMETGEKGGMLASMILIPIEMAWFHGQYEDINKGIQMAELALENTLQKMPDWKSPALAVLIRLHLMEGNVEAAEKIASTEQLNPIMAVIRSRFLALISLAGIELELAKHNFQFALSQCDNLLEEISKLTWIHHPEILHDKAVALIGLNRLEEAAQVLTEARVMSEKLDTKFHLWVILSSLSDVSEKLGQQEEAKNYRKQAQEIVLSIADRFEDHELKQSFLNQPRIQKLMN